MPYIRVVLQYWGLIILLKLSVFLYLTIVNNNNNLIIYYTIKLLSTTIFICIKKYQAIVDYRFLVKHKFT